MDMIAAVPEWLVWCAASAAGALALAAAGQHDRSRARPRDLSRTEPPAPGRDRPRGQQEHPWPSPNRTPRASRRPATPLRPSRSSSKPSPSPPKPCSPPTRAWWCRDNHNSLRPALRGPTLLEDFLLREKLTHFDHERIPERVVHRARRRRARLLRADQAAGAVHQGRLPAGGRAAARRCSCASPPWPARAARPTRCATCAASRSSSTPAKATTTWWATTCRCSSSRTR